MVRRPLLFLLSVPAAVGLFFLAVHWSNRSHAGQTCTMIIGIADASSNAPIPLILDGPNYAGADPWQRKVTRTARDKIQIQWVERDAPAWIRLNSPGYQSVGVELGYRQRAQITIGLRPALPATAPTTSAVIPSPTR